MSVGFGANIRSDPYRPCFAPFCKRSPPFEPHYFNHVLLYHLISELLYFSNRIFYDFKNRGPKLIYARRTANVTVALRFAGLPLNIIYGTTYYIMLRGARS